MLFRKNIAKPSRVILICIGGALLCRGLLLTQSSAHNYTVNPNPGTYQAVQREVTSSIPANLEEAQCGGWDLDESVVGKVAQVQGFPGHDGIPICNADNVRSGMAMRIESQILPATMGVDLCGYRSACRPIEWLSVPPGGSATEDEWWDRLRPYPPFYRILPCQRPLGGIHSWQNPQTIGRNNAPISFTCGGGTMPSDGHVCDTMEGLTWWGPEPDGIGKDGLCAYMNENWLYGYYEKKIWVGANCEFVSDSYPGDGVRTCRVTVYREGPCTYKPGEIEQTIAPLEGYAPMQRIENRQCCTRLGPIVFSPNGPTCMPAGYGAYDYGESYGPPPCQATGDLCQRQECLEWTGCVTKQKCDDGNACTVGTCDPLTGACSYTNVNCDDGNQCTVEKGCDPQKGCIREKLDCPDNPNPCMQSYCNPAVGCSTRPTICPDDHDKCTTQQCVPSQGGCVSTFIPGRAGCQECRNVDCDDGNVCTADVCDPDILLDLLAQEQNRGPGDPPVDLTLSCQHYPVSCDDGDECTRDVCVDGCGCTNIPGACEPDPCSGWPDPPGSDRWNCRSCCGDTCTSNAGAPPAQHYPIWRFELIECENRCIRVDDDGVCVERARISCDGGEDYLTKQPSVNRITYPKRGRTYLSYYRHYVEGSYKRNRVPAAPKDQHRKEDIPASCYGMYRVYDPKTNPVSNMYKNCVIAAYYGGSKRNFYEMLKAPGSTQEGRGSYYFDHDDIDIFVRDPSFDRNTDLWDPEFANAFSLSNDKIFEERFNNDITLLLFQPQDIAKLEATVQLESDWEGDTRSEVRRSLSIGSLIRAFDDSVYTVNYNDYDTDVAQQMKDRGYPRVVTTWLQEQESHLHYVVNSSVIRMILPPDWSVGLDPLDPLYTPKLVTACGSYLYENSIAHDDDPRMQVLEVQLQAEDDTMDTIKAFLLRSLMPTIRYEPVPVLIPMGSPTEFRAIAEGWKGWMKKQNSGEAEQLVSMLEKYARYIEEVRTLRGEIAWHASELLTQQNELAGVIGGWLDERVLAQYGEFMSQMDFIREVQGIWKSAIRRLRRSHDIDCMPWCHNDRFTTSIYSLLDPWSQRAGTLTANNSLPSLTPPKGINAVFDFSLLKPPTGILEFPVVEPIQVRIDLQKVAAPDVSVADPVIPILPALPPIPQLAENLKRRTGDDLHLYGWPLTIGQRDTPRGITFELWSEGQRKSLRESVQRIASRIRVMANEYSLFWKSMSIKQKDMKAGTEQDCYRAHADTCVHAEMDLRERLQRFGARPAVFLFEDFLSIGEFRPDSAFLANSEGEAATGYGIESCPPEDWTCQLLVQHKDYPPQGWAIDWYQIRPREDAQICPYSLSGDPLIDQLRVCTFNETLLRKKAGDDYVPVEPGSSGGEGLFPYDAQRNTIVPSFAIPPVFRLIETVGPQKVDDSESD